MKGNITAGLITGLGAIVAVIGSMTPWATITAPLLGSVSVNGTQGDGLITLILGLVAIGLAIGIASAVSPRGFAAGASIIGGIIFIIAAVDLNNVQRVVEDANYSSDLVLAQVGGGLYATLIGGIGITLGGLVGVFGSRGLGTHTIYHAGGVERTHREEIRRRIYGQTEEDNEPPV